MKVQLDECKSELELLRSSKKAEIEAKDEQIKLLQTTVKGFQQANFI
jgi:hypothetical protein